MKKLTKHTIYEVWNEWTAESVFVDHKPTEEEIQELIKLQDWNSSHRKDISVDKVKKIYTKSYCGKI